MQDKLKNIVLQFNIPGNFVKGVAYGCGHINDTYLIETDTKKYILQRINHNVFKNVDGLMSNIVGVTEHIKTRLQKDGKDVTNALSVIYTLDGKPYYFDGENYYRLYNFITDGVSIETRATKEEFYLSAVGFGRFQKLLDGYPSENLWDTIVDFHNTRRRFENFKIAMSENKAMRLDSVQEEVKFFLDRERYTGIVVDMLASGELPTRVTHNDTKLNNVLIDMNAKRASSVIDLDTVMAGSLLYDFGDSIRSGATTAAEDEIDLSKVNFDIELFEAYTKGFVEEVGERLTEKEIEYLAFGAILMTFECGMRFLTDYLNGDTYFKIKREHHNLDRARTQIKLVKDMEKRLDEMNDIVKRYLK